MRHTCLPVLLPATAHSTSSASAEAVTGPPSLPSNSVFPGRQGRHIHFLETLHELAARVAGSELPEELDMMINDKMVSKLPKVCPSTGLGQGLAPAVANMRGCIAPWLTHTWPVSCLQEGAPRYNAAGE